MHASCEVLAGGELEVAAVVYMAGIPGGLGSGCSSLCSGYERDGVGWCMSASGMAGMGSHHVVIVGMVGLSVG